MNATKYYGNSASENPNALVSTLALEQGGKQIEHASRISASPQPIKKRSSGLADSGWYDAWSLRGIPEMDSPLAG
ncbi:MAG TPA: hypothetical protein VME24_10960 [Alphaproteobacteria bacterium]|nr:hypothetical protein [Alphaproteobacteria bacterium]